MTLRILDFEAFRQSVFFRSVLILCSLWYCAVWSWLWGYWSC